MIAVTFDVDDVAWSTGAAADELRDAVPQITALLAEFPEVRTTWFVRLDAGIAAARGRPDALFREYAAQLDALRAAKHEVAWHHHAVQRGSVNTPETDSPAICRALQELAPCAKSWGLESVRLGWAHADAMIIACLDDLGFLVDSSALPRPAYAWDIVPRDWEAAPQRPYRPARDNHRGEGTPACAILEVPISVAILPVHADTQPDVQRYVNLAYHTDAFGRALRAVTDWPVIVTVTHPYECLPTGDDAPTPTAALTRKHPLLAHDVDVLRHNLTQLHSLNRPFLTMRQLGAHYAATA